MPVSCHAGQVNVNMATNIRVPKEEEVEEEVGEFLDHVTITFSKNLRHVDALL